MASQEAGNFSTGLLDNSSSCREPVCRRRGSIIVAKEVVLAILCKASPVLFEPVIKVTAMCP